MRTRDGSADSSTKTTTHACILLQLALAAVEPELFLQRQRRRRRALGGGTSRITHIDQMLLLVGKTWTAIRYLRAT